MAMTQPQEAAYALDYGLDREGLRPEVRAEYDRLKQERHFATTRAVSAQQPPAQHEQHSAGRPPRGTIPARKLILGGAVVVLVIVAAIIGHAISSGRAALWPGLPRPGPPPPTPQSSGLWRTGTPFPPVPRRGPLAAHRPAASVACLARGAQLTD